MHIFNCISFPRLYIQLYIFNCISSSRCQGMMHESVPRERTHRSNFTRAGLRNVDIGFWPTEQIVIIIFIILLLFTRTRLRKVHIFPWPTEILTSYALVKKKVILRWTCSFYIVMHKCDKIKASSTLRIPARRSAIETSPRSTGQGVSRPRIVYNNI